MKVPPKRKGNNCVPAGRRLRPVGLNESPSEKEGKYEFIRRNQICLRRLNESPSEKEGKSDTKYDNEQVALASMKVPPKRKGNHS